MTDVQVVQIAADAIGMAAKLGGPVLIVTLVLGVLVALFQAVTQVQEMALSFVPKLVGVAAVIVLGGHWMLAQLVGWVHELWSSIPSMLS